MKSRNLEILTEISPKYSLIRMRIAELLILRRYITVDNPHHKHQTPLLHRNNMIRWELSHFAMARPRRKARKKVLLFVLLLAFSHIPFFLERQTVRQPPDPPTELLHECCQQRTTTHACVPFSYGLDERTLPGLDFRTSRYSSETCLHKLLPGSEIRDSRFTSGHF